MKLVNKLSLASAMAVIGWVGIAQAATTVPVHGTSQVTWTKSATGDLNDLPVSDRTGALVFIRPMANANTQVESSTNIGVNGRFLTSLQDGHYSVAQVCAGDVSLSAVPTAARINDLNLGAVSLKVQPKQIQYFVVQTKDNFTPVLTQIDAKQANQLLAASPTFKQNHQISRVKPHNCPAPAPQVVEKVVEVPVVVEKVVEVPVQTPYYVEKRPNLRLHILFDVDKSVIKKQYQGEITKAAKFLSQYPDAKVIVEGHTDSTGSDAYNQKLSERRAKAVAQALLQQHAVSQDRLSTEGFGESRPVADNATPAGREENRRVMVVISNQN